MIRPDPKKIIVPRKHGEILIEPPLSQLVSTLNSRPSVLTPPQRDAVSAQSLSVHEQRAQARAQFLRAAAEWAAITGAEAPPPDAENKSWVITGHQVEFYHAGVWAKVLAADDLAGRTNAIAFDILVDHDLIDRIGFDVPVEKGNGGWGRTWEGPPEASSTMQSLPAESLSAPTLNAFLQWDSALSEYPATHTDSMAHYLSALRHACAACGAGVSPARNAGILPADRQFTAQTTQVSPGAESPPSYTQWMSRARAGFESSFNIEVHHVPATWICRGPAWDSFVQAWMDNAEQWTEVYNRHLAAYRQRQGIKSNQHPMPDLHRDAARGQFELPFWISEPGQPRERLLFQVDPNRNPNPSHVRPRAVTFTMFVRLFLADLFIHGIGGALYDQITDAILEELFHTVPPYACVSAAWLLPLGQAFPAEDLSALKWRRHHIQHNPQLAIDPFTALRSEVAELILERKNLVQQISRSLAEARHSERAARRDWFACLHQVNQQLHQKAPRLLPNLDRQVDDARAAMEQNKVLLWREWFFALHSRASLEELQKAIATHA